MLGHVVLSKSLPSQCGLQHFHDSTLLTLQAREYVDRVHNCEDLLVNYMLAAKLNGTQVWLPIRLVHLHLPCIPQPSSFEVPCCLEQGLWETGTSQGGDLPLPAQLRQCLTEAAMHTRGLVSHTFPLH